MPATPWDGVACPRNIDSDHPTILFHVPRGEEQRDYFSLPTPNDVQTTAAGHPRLLGFPGLVRFPEPGSLLSTYQALAEGRTGFGAHGAVLFRFSHTLEYESLEFGGESGNFFFVDITPDARNFGRTPPSRFFATAQRSRYICQNWIGIRPASGSALMAGHTYAVYFRRGLLDSNGVPYEASSDLGSLLNSTPPLHPRMLAGWNRYGLLRDYLSQSSIPSEDIVGATVFTVGDPGTRFEGVAAAVAAAPVSTLDAVHICRGQEATPCGEIAPRTCGPASEKYTEVHARALLPNFLRGAPPYDQYGGDAEFSDGSPILQRQEPVCISLTVPKSDPPEAGWPVAFFVHDIGGHFRTGMERGLAGNLAERGWVTMSFDGVLHGPRIGLDGLPTNAQLMARLNNVYRPKLMVDQILQGLSDLHALTRLLPGLDLAIDGAVLPISTTELAVVSEGWGSESALHFLVEHPAVRTGALAETAGDWIIRLRSDESPINFPNIMSEALNDPELDAMHPGLHLIQDWLEQRDPVSFAHRLRSPPNGLEHKNVLLLYGERSPWASDEARSAFARATRIPTLTAYEGFLGGLNSVESASLPLRLNVAGVATQGIKLYGSDADQVDSRPVLSISQARADIARFIEDARSDENGPSLEP